MKVILEIFLRKELGFEEKFGNILDEGPELVLLLEQVTDFDQRDLKIKNSIKINPKNLVSKWIVPEIGQLETDLENSLEELLEKRIEALEEGFGILFDDDLQLELLDNEQIFDLDQESLKAEKSK